MKLHVPSVKVPKRNSLIVILAALIVVAVLSAAIVHFESQKKVEAASAEKARLTQVEKQRKADQAIANYNEAQKQLIQVTTDKVAVCNAIAKLPKAKAVPLPAQCR